MKDKQCVTNCRIREDGLRREYDRLRREWETSEEKAATIVIKCTNHVSTDTTTELKEMVPLSLKRLTFSIAVGAGESVGWINIAYKNAILGI